MGTGAPVTPPTATAAPDGGELATDHLRELLAQHDELRALMDACERLAEALDGGGPVHAELAAEVGRLRASFDRHNRYEETLLRPVLLEEEPRREDRVDRMVREHVDEHGAVRASLGGPATADLRASIAMLRTHLAAEETYFRRSRVLRHGKQDDDR
jgi:hypothetical protein